MANFNFNKVILGGRLCADPELKVTPSGVSVTTFTVAVNRRVKAGEEAKADFFNVTAWRQTAEFVTKYFRKASSICVCGVLQTRQWTDNAGQTHHVTEIVADEAYFVDAKGSPAIQANAPAPAQGQAVSGAAGQKTPMPGMYGTVSSAELEELSGDEELPF